MTLLKKINTDWKPSENPDLKVGETIQVTDYRQLVHSGAAILVDDQGNEVPLPGQVFICPICYTGANTLAEFVTHVDSHKKQPAKPVEVAVEVQREEETKKQGK